MRAFLRGRLRRPSHATVVAYLALFVALGGSAAAVTYVVSSNSQIGPDTVSGARPPAGKHSNIIGGSIGPGDLGGSAVTADKLGTASVGTRAVADNKLTGADILESSLGPVPNAAKLGGLSSNQFVQGSGTVYDINNNANVNGGAVELFDVPNELTLTAFCKNTSDPGPGQYSFATGNDPVTILTDNGGGDPTKLDVGSHSSAGSSFWSIDDTDFLTFSVTSPTATITIWVGNWLGHSTFPTPHDFCHFQGHAIATAH
jgi:hypothetical protein